MSTTETSIEIQIAQTPSCALTDPQKKAELYAFLENEIAAFVPDLETEKGRKAIASLSYKIAQTKSAIDAAGAKLKEDWLRQSREVDAGRREIRDRLDALKDRAREPLTRWEREEDRRLEFVSQFFDMFRNVVAIKTTDTSETVQALIKQTEQFVIDPAVFRDRHEAAVLMRAQSLRSLRLSLDKLLEDEFDRQELARLRKKDEERREQDRIAAEAAELARLTQQRQEREAQRLLDMEAARVKAEEARLEREAKIAEQSKIDTENRLRKEFDEAQRIERARVQAELDKERKAQADAQEAHRREQERLRIANEKAAAEEKKLAANRKHRTEVMTRAAEELRTALPGLSEAIAHKVIGAIAGGKLSAVSVNFGSQQ